MVVHSALIPTVLPPSGAAIAILRPVSLLERSLGRSRLDQNPPEQGLVEMLSLGLALFIPTLAPVLMPGAVAPSPFLALSLWSEAVHIGAVWRPGAALRRG